MARTTLEDVAWWIAQLEMGRTQQGEFDGPAFLRPHHFVVLACEVHRRRATAVTIPQPLQGYAARMRLWQSIGLTCPMQVNERNPGGRFRPLTPISSEATAQALADDITEVFNVCGTEDKKTLGAINVTLSEIFSNCFFHAEACDGEARICGLACAQSWPHEQLAQVAVADIGIGIRASLGANPAYVSRLAQENANAVATELGVTGKPQGRHSGYGLALARQLMEKHDGNLLIVSGTEAFRATAHGVEMKQLSSPWAGTIVVLEWDMARPFDILSVYSEWPSDEESDELI
jgi:anti-sigma regulatory factor (Ser/Thr protein kinase)